MERNHVKALIATLLVINREEGNEEHSLIIPNAILEAEQIILHCEMHPDQILKDIKNGLNWDHMKEAQG